MLSARSLRETAMTEFLIEQGADVNVTTKVGHEFAKCVSKQL